MRIKWKGRDLGEFSGMPTLREARRIKSLVRMLPNEWQLAMQQGDPDATTALVAIMLERNGERPRFDKLDGEFDDLDVELSEEEKEEAAAAQAEEVSPVIRAILAELEVDVDADKVGEVVLRHLREAQDEQGEGDAGEQPAAETSTPESEPQPPDSGSTSGLPS